MVKDKMAKDKQKEKSNSMKAIWLGAKSLEKLSDADNGVLMQIRTSVGGANRSLHKGVYEAANHIEQRQTDLFNDDLNFHDSQFG